jgi:hypothetical protein
VSTTHKLQGIAVVLFILVMATAFVLPNGGNERGDKAWADRLNGQAVYEQAQAQEARARAAYAARYAGQTQSFDKLIKQADAARVERANKAWSDRLTAQAAGEAAK